MEEHISAGQGARSRFGEHLWLDIRLLGADHINGQLREVKEICQYFLGIDPAQELIPVRPAQHYSMGGVRTDPLGQSPQLKGLFSVGESACWDMHGFNRLGGNSVAETVVAGMIVGESIADFCASEEGHLQLSTTLANDFLRRETEKLKGIADNSGKESAVELTREMQETMTNKVGIFRHGDTLQQAVNELQDLQRRAAQVGLRSAARGPNPELVAAYRLPRMLKLALCVAAGALQRTESRGAHFRDDFPQRNDLQWMQRTLASWPEASDELPTIDYEPLDIQQMELPPGWRGYGARDYIEHPDTARREQQIEALLATAGDLDRHQKQDLLMPFLHLLPAPFRGQNQRLESSE
jgi:fumarate reductase flavoprotein subunit